MKVYVGFSTSNRFLAKLIRLVTRSSVSHTYFKIPVPHHQRSLIFQASGVAVNLESENIFLDTSIVIEEFEVNLSPEKAHAFEEFMLNNLGVPYSVKHLVGMLWVLLCRGLGLKVRNPLKDSGHSYVCVEMVAKLLGIEGAEEMTPQDLYSLFLAHHVSI